MSNRRSLDPHVEILRMVEGPRRMLVPRPAPPQMPPVLLVADQLSALGARGHVPPISLPSV